MSILSYLLVALVIGIVYLVVKLRQTLATAKPVGKQPPTVSGKYPFIGAGLDWLHNPREFLNQKRKELGDVFILEAFGLKLFFVFSNSGLTEFYHIPESNASFLEATRAFLGYKVPAEVMKGEMPTIQKVLRRDFQKLWLERLNQSVRHELEDLGKKGTLDVFKWTKQVMHRAGFSVWVGSEATEKDTLQKLIALFDQIDPEQGFQDMSSLFFTIINRRAAENAALRELFHTIYKGRKMPKRDFLEAMFDEFSDLPEKEQAIRATCSILAIHMASQSNLFAAVAWTIVNILQYHEQFAAVMNEIDGLKERYGEKGYTNDIQAMDGLDHLDKCFHESIRLAQQSLTLRLVLKPIQIDGYTVVPDENLLPKASQFLPEEHYDKGGRAKAITGADHSVSTFGHLVHQCPGKKFAITAAKICIVSLFDQFVLEHQFTEVVQIIPTQIGAVGRPISPALVSYKRRSTF